MNKFDQMYKDRYDLASAFLNDWLRTEAMNTSGDEVLEHLREENEDFCALSYEDQCYLSDVIVDICRVASIEVGV